MKIRRLGFTEGTLLFIRWLKIEKIKLHESEIKEITQLELNMINWLHTTSGFYNKDIKGDYFNIDIENYNYTYLNLYLDLIKESLLNADIIFICIHKFSEDIAKYKNIFINNFHANEIRCISREDIYKFIKNKRVLIISSFAKLIKIQYESENVYKIYNNFPQVKSMVYYTSPYTFFNSGPDNNSLETYKNICNDIIKINDDYDVMVISFGSYSNLIANYFDSKFNKETLTLGDQLQSIFGILNTRTRNNVKLENEEYYIKKIPEEYKPNNYMKIENGCYW